MKKSLIALAVLGASAAAMAQSSVTLFGIVDAGVARTSATGAGHRTGLISGGAGTSRLGFRGVEDLGGGLRAGFWIEGQLNNDVGGGATQTTGFDFMRRSTISLSGRFGEVRIGRDFTPTYLNMIGFEPWGGRGIASIGTLGQSTGGVNSYARNSNSVTYFLPAGLGGIYGAVQYMFGEQASNRAAIADAAGISTSAANAITSKTGNYLGGRIGYATGPFNVAGGYAQYSDAVRTTGIAAAPFYAANYKIANIGASWDFGFIKPMIFVGSDKIDGRAAAPNYKFNTYAISATAPVGTGLVKAQFVRYDNKTQGASANDASQFGIGYVYTLSKRTSIYADAARMSNKGNAVYTLSNNSSSLVSPVPTAGGNATGFAVGIKHAF